MQIIGKKSNVLLIAVSIIMLVAIGVSFAMWDTSSVKATNSDLSTYANAKVGDIIDFGMYYQDINLKEVDGNYKKTAITWIVVDKDERSGQLTLMSKYILACGSYFGSWYDDGSGYNWNYNKTLNASTNEYIYSTAEVGGVPYNQAYVDSTVRAFLNNLERLDLGGDKFTETGYLPSNKNSTIDTGLLSSIGFSNQRYWTNQYTSNEGNSDLLSKPGFFKRHENAEIYYQRPISNEAYAKRPVTRGFFDEAFDDKQKSMIAPKEIAGYTGHRWPDSKHDISTKSYVEGSADKVWLPSATELNVANGVDWNSSRDDSWTNPSDEASSTVFEYFKNYNQYKNPYSDRINTSLSDALIAKRTSIAANGMIGNYSIPVYDKGTTTAKTEISISENTSEHYWTRSPMSYWYTGVRIVHSSGEFSADGTCYSYVGVRPCINLKY